MESSTSRSSGERRKIDGVGRRHPLLVAVEPVVLAVGGSVIPAAKLRKGDIELVWDGEVVGAVRLPVQPVGIERLLIEVQENYERPLKELNREQKQAVVHWLSERGAFDLRRSVEDVADALGVSRFTVYNYLNAVS